LVAVAEIDLNADLGESYGAWTLGDDDSLLDAVTSANVACGFHAGDPSTMLRTVAAALERGVAIGAQVSYPDLVGFGRRDMELAPDEIIADVLYQIGALEGITRAAGGHVTYVKPHGALYNRAARDPVVATAIATAIVRYGAGLPMVMLAGSTGLQAAADAGVQVVPESFADRGYTPDCRLVSRREPGALVTSPDEVVARVLRMVTDGTVVAIDGSVLRLGARSVCVHGDTPGAAALARRVRTALEDAGVEVRSLG
jgi:5-oxoprolinase (ATP-hydrolysing) subunit A